MRFYMNFLKHTATPLLSIVLWMNSLSPVLANQNFILDTDSYKASHWLQFPAGTQSTFSYLESRGGKYDKTVFFGLQYILKEYFSKPVTIEMVDEAKDFFKAHGLPFNYDDWLYIATELKGKLPIRIRAVQEGTVVPVSNVLMTVESTDARAYWLPSWVETQLMRVWYPTTVATTSWQIKQLIKQFLNETADHADEEILFKLHDFGSRGVSSHESAGIGGASHLINFLGSDTVIGVVFANKYYSSAMSGFSIPAAEHSTITSYGKEGEVDAYRNMLQQFARPNSLLAVVSDSYDLHNAVENIWGKILKKDVINSGATVIIRPDSGNPTKIVLDTLKLLEKSFGVTMNSKNYKVLNHVRVIQGDGIDADSIHEILTAVKAAGFSASNVAFGMGGALLQKIDRDTQKFAYKCSSITVNGQDRDIFKDPVTDPGKRSKKGKLDLVIDPKGVTRFRTVSGIDSPHSALQIVYENGDLKIDQSLDQIRRNSME